MKWSSRVKDASNSLLIRLLAVLAAVGAVRVSVLLRSGRRVVCLILFMALVISIFGVGIPVARADIPADISVPVMLMGSSSSGDLAWIVQAVGIPYIYTPSPSSQVGCVISIDGVTGTTTQFNSDGHLPYADMHCIGMRALSASWKGWFGDNQLHTVSWTAGSNNCSGYTWHIAAGSFQTKLVNLGWTAAASFGYVPALSVSLSGPSAVSSVDGGTWTATGAGGTAPYTYAWTYGAIGPFFSWPHLGSTFTRVLPVGDWTIECQVTDSTGATAIVDQVVTSSLIVGAYTVHLVRSGVYGQIMSAQVHNAEGTYIGIADASGTQLGIYADLDPPNELSYGYYDNQGVYGGSNDGAADGSTGLWRWTMAFTVGEATVPPPANFWFKASLTLTDDTVLLVTHHFGGISDIADSWYEPGGNDVAPEVPPVPGSKLPAWLQAFLDAVYILLSPIILVAEILKMLFNWIVGLLGYIGGAISIVASFGLLMVRWLTVVVASVFNFATAAPGSYVSIQGLMTLAGAGAIAGDTSVFKTVGFSVSSIDTVLGAIHTWVMASSHQWIWWAAFSYAFLAFVLQLGGGSGGEE